MGASNRSVYRSVLAAGLAATTLLFACNALIGLDEYEKVPAVIDAGKIGDDSGVVVVELPEGTLPATWARWHVTETVTGITGVADKDGGVSRPGSGGTVEAVLDTTTKLVWQRATTTAVSYVEAQKICANLGDGTWRMPSRIELVSLLEFSDAGARPNRIDLGLFPGASTDPTWTASPLRPLTNPVQMWTVRFQNGTEVLKAFPVGGDTNLKAVRCVRGGLQ